MEYLNTNEQMEARAISTYCVRGNLGQEQVSMEWTGHRAGSVGSQDALLHHEGVDHWRHFLGPRTLALIVGTVV